jgi:large subunit ribosomal protein L28e
VSWYRSVGSNPRSNIESSRIYKGVADHAGKNSYRADLNRDAIARASAIKYSQRPKKDARERKPRGAKAKKIEE